jgi:nucleoside-diphosphate-sugar epimerase
LFFIIADVSMFLYMYLYMSGYDEAKTVKTFVGDVTDSSIVREACTGVNSVIHLVALIDVGTAPNKKAMETVNVQGMGPGGWILVSSH